MTMVYGISSCATVKKARAWLDDNGIQYIFVDFKKQAPTAELIATWLQHIPLSVLLNKRGTTWRKLTPYQQARAENQDDAIALMLEYPSVIKRPVLVHQDKIIVGFDIPTYQIILGQ